MQHRPYYPDLIDALRETVRRIEAVAPGDPAVDEVKKSILLTLARLTEPKESKS
jgi:hypothetical protein